MESEKQIALYYPYIDIEDPGLIKTAALYWDELRTIVPESVSEPYQLPVSKEAVAYGFLKTRVVSSADGVVDKAGEEFAADIEKEPIKQNIIKLLRLAKRKKFFEIHDDKWQPLHMLRVWSVLQDEIPFSPSLYTNSVIFPAPIGYAYMVRLAGLISQNDSAIPLTDIPPFENIFADRFIDYADEQKLNQSELARLSLQSISIKPDTPLINVLTFRDKHRQMLLNFRRKIRGLSRQVAQGLDTTNKQRIFEEIIKDEILPAKVEIEAKLKENNVVFVAGCVLGVLAGCAGIVISKEWLGHLVSRGILTGAALVGNIRKERMIVAGDPLGYLYQAQKQFGV